jgi:hypothetical protein
MLSFTGERRDGYGRGHERGHERGHGRGHEKVRGGMGGGMKRKPTGRVAAILQLTWLEHRKSSTSRDGLRARGELVQLHRLLVALRRFLTLGGVQRGELGDYVRVHESMVHHPIGVGEGLAPVHLH